MQTLYVEVEDSIAEKIVAYLKSFQGTKIKNITQKERFIEECEQSKQEQEEGKTKQIDDIDSFVENL